jgi:hypothetical protein
MNHTLIVKNVLDGIAECECGKWKCKFGRKTTVLELIDWWMRHAMKGLYK